MAVKSFIRGDFRTLIVDNDYPTNYKVYYNGKWNYIQDEESFINKLNPDLGESYLNRFNLKVLDNNQWVPLAILENYYNKNEKRNSIFYRTITRENFIFKPRAVNFTEVDARLGLNNLQTPFVSNESKFNKKEIEEVTDKIQKDEILYKLNLASKFDELYQINYKKSEEENLTSDTSVKFYKEWAELAQQQIECEDITFYETSAIEKNKYCSSNDFATSIRLLQITEKDTDVIYKASTMPDFTYDDVTGRIDSIVVNNEANKVVQDVICFDGTKPLSINDSVERNDFCARIKINEVTVD